MKTNRPEAVLPPELVGAMREAVLTVARRCDGPDARWRARQRLHTLRYLLRERPWRLVDSEVDADALLGNAIEGWLRGPARAIVALDTLDVVVAELSRAIQATPPELHVPYVSLERALDLDPLEAATLGLLYAVGHDDASLDIALAEHEVLRPGLGVAAPGLSESMVLSLLADEGARTAQSRLSRLIRLGVVQRVPELVGRGTYLRFSPPIASMLRSDDTIELSPGVWAWPERARPALARLCAERWPEAEDIRLSDVPRQRFVLICNERDAAESIAAWLLGAGRQLRVDGAVAAFSHWRWLGMAVPALATGIWVHLDERRDPLALLDPWGSQVPGPVIISTPRSLLGLVARAIPRAVVIDLEEQRAEVAEVATALGGGGASQEQSTAVRDLLRTGRLLDLGDRRDGAWTSLQRISEQRMMGSAQLLRDPRCPLVLPERTQRDVDEVFKVLRHVRDRPVEEVVQSERRRLFVLLEGEQTILKRQTAYAMGRVLGRPVFQIDMASVLSKYIGETEKRMQELFDLAQRTGAALYMEEAHDFLGKRFEIQKATDRYASMQVNHMLQALDAFSGVLILTSSAPSALDPALIRRILYRISFNPLDAAARGRFWQAMLPERAPVEGFIDWEDLGEAFVLTPDDIQKAIFHAAILAARAGGPLKEDHLYDAAATLLYGAE